MNNWTIGSRIKLGFALIIIIGTIIGAGGYYSGSRNAEEIHGLGAVRLPSVEYLQNIRC